VASFLGRHGKKESVLPALRVVHAAPACQLPVNLRGEVMAGFGLPQIHGAIMPSSDVAGKDASRADMAITVHGTFG
jgi:hypothetical protein